MKYAIFAIFLLFSACNTTSNVQRVEPEDDLNKMIQEAAPGTVIQLKKKVYRISQRINIRNKKQLTIDGRGAQIILDDPNSDVLFMMGCEDIVLKNFMAKHTDPQGPVGCTGNVLHLMDNSNVLVEDCELNGSGIVGISAYSTDLNIKNCHFHHNSEYAIIYMGPKLALADSRFDNNGHDNAIFFEYIAEGAEAGWPPQHSITSDTQKKGLLMRNNSFE